MWSLLTVVQPKTSTSMLPPHSMPPCTARDKRYSLKRVPRPITCTALHATTSHAIDVRTRAPPLTLTARLNDRPSPHAAPHLPHAKWLSKKSVAMFVSASRQGTCAPVLSANFVSSENLGCASCTHARERGREAREQGYVCARSEMAHTERACTHLSNKLKLDGRTGEHLMAGIH